MSGLQGAIRSTPKTNNENEDTFRNNRTKEKKQASKHSLQRALIVGMHGCQANASTEGHPLSDEAQLLLQISTARTLAPLHRLVLLRSDDELCCALLDNPGG